MSGVRIPHRAPGCPIILPYPFVISMHPALRIFVVPTAVSVALLAGIFGYLGIGALLVALLLVVLEVTLSFDNAVVNAKVLKLMDPVWQQRFLTWGILLAACGPRAAPP